MAEKKKGRRAYLEDYRKNERGQYEYAGRRYVCQGVDLGRRRARIGALCAGLAAAMAAVGCVDAPGMRGCFYVLLPYLAGVVAVGGTCLAAYRLCAGGDPMKAYAYETGLRKLPGRAAFAAVCAGLAVVGEIAYALRHGSGGKAAGLAAFLILETAAAALALLLRQDAEKLNSCCTVQSD